MIGPSAAVSQQAAGRRVTLASWSSADGPIPRELVGITNHRRHETVRELRLADYPFERLPRWLSALTGLERLEIDVRSKARPLASLENLPQSVGTLVLRGADLKELPAARASVGVRALHLQAVGIESLEPGLRSFSGLQELVIESPGLIRLPDEIGKLSSLRRLAISSQRLQVLPPSIGLLSDSLDLELHCPRLPDTVQVLAERGIPELFTYLRSIAADGEPQYEAKVILIGEGNVGKSCLITALQGGEFLEGRPTTHGIEVSSLDLPQPGPQPPTPNDSLRLNLGDFGGQEVYRIGHQFFYSSRSLYILVWRPREGREENAVEDWIRRVRLRMRDQVRILIVSTHCDADQRSPELDLPHLQQKYPGIIAGQFAVDSRTGTGIEELRAALAQEAARLPQMGELVARDWQVVRTRLQDLAATRPFISWKEYLDLCADSQLGDAAAITLAALLHDLGRVIHFGGESGLGDIVVLQPEWLTRAVGYVLEDAPTREADGVLSYNRLGQIWGGAQERQAYSELLYPYFLRLMEVFDFSYRLEEGDRALVAQLVPFRRPELPWRVGQRPPASEHEATLICTFSEPPVGLMAWLTVRNHRYWTGSHWRRGVFLRSDEYGSSALFELTSDTELRLTVRGPSPYMLFALLRDSVAHLIDTRWPGLTRQFHIPCPTRSATTTPCEGRFSLDSLETFKRRGRGTIDCHTCAETHDIISLLTGFDPQPSSTPEMHQMLERVESLVSRTRDDTTQIMAAQHELHTELGRLRSELGLKLLAVRRLLTNEMKDCPTLYSLAPRRSFNPLTARYLLTLWCEETGTPHPWPEATYDLHAPRALVKETLPYLKVILPILEVGLPVLGRLTADAVSEVDLKAAQELLASTRELLHGREDSAVDWAVPYDDPNEGPRRGFRTYRHILLERDPDRRFGGLTRRITPTGDVVWLCRHHLLRYDPGLPTLPASA